MTIAACDDDSLILTQLHNILDTEDKDDHELSFSGFSNSMSLLSVIDNGSHFDLYLLDILMPGVNGLDLAHAIRSADDNALIVFLTSSPEFAVDSYDVDAFGYLLKPVIKEKLTALITRAKLICNHKNTDNILINCDGKLRSIPIHSIVCIEALRNKLLFILNNKERLSSYGTITDIKTRLCSDPHFIQPHRSYLINMEYIMEFKTNSVQMKYSDAYIPVSRANYHSIKTSYINYMMLKAEGTSDDK